jgi:diaminohydroxyphosphoribosylaminopyrimidine deaminase/5-amino-6-(5-phosphoribosylamino)uracil reductase
MSINHQIFMQRAIDIALIAKGNTSPNPIVGAVLVYKNEIIAEGFHAFAGGPHAEVNCLRDFDIQKYEEPNDLFLYVTLEPCTHYGKTPPCCDLILESGLTNIIVGQVDPNPKVAGNSIKKLEAAGRNVVVGVLGEECKALNPAFITNHNHQRPYVILKWAETKDGFLARENFDSKWISNEVSRKYVHKLRADLDGILVGKNTAKSDNPSLNVRDWKGNSPIRVVLDPRLELDQTLNLFDGSIKTIIVNGQIDKVEGLTEWVQFDFEKFNIESLLTILFDRGICSILIEGGSHTLNQFLTANVWDKAYVFQSDIEFGKGITAPMIKHRISETLQLMNDCLNIYSNE